MPDQPTGRPCSCSNYSASGAAVEASYSAVERIFVAAVLWLAASCGPKCPHRPPIAPDAPPMLWRVEGAGAVMYLFGTHHLAGTADVPRAAWDALDSSALLINEVATQPPPDFAARVRRAGPGLDQQLRADSWYELRDRLRGRVDEAELRTVAPWYAMSLLSAQVAGRSPDHVGMDEALGARAAERNMELVHLETWDEQLALLEGISIADLEQAIADLPNMPCVLGDSLHAYRAGQLRAFAATFDAAREETFLRTRNARWLPRLEERLAAQPVAFVAVGVSHLAGEFGLLRALETRGYRVTRL